MNKYATFILVFFITFLFLQNISRSNEIIELQKQVATAIRSSENNTGIIMCQQLKYLELHNRCEKLEIPHSHEMVQWYDKGSMVVGWDVSTYSVKGE